jgi:hypothetical protein
MDMEYEENKNEVKKKGCKGELCEKRRTKKIGRMQKVNCVKREE